MNRKMLEQETKELKSIKATLLFEWEQFIRKYHLKETEDKMLHFIELTRKEITHAIMERDLQRVFKLLEKERKSLEQTIQKSLVSEISHIQEFLHSKKHLFTQLQAKIPNLSKLPLVNDLKEEIKNFTHFSNLSKMNVLTNFKELTGIDLLAKVKKSSELAKVRAEKVTEKLSKKISSSIDQTINQVKALTGQSFKSAASKGKTATKAASKATSKKATIIPSKKVDVKIPAKQATNLKPSVRVATSKNTMRPKNTNQKRS